MSTSTDSCHPCVRYVVYFEVLTNIALGSISSFLGIYAITTDEDASHYVNAVVIAAGVCSIVGALLLLFGTIKAKRTHVLTYLVLTTPSLLVESIKIGFEIIRFDLSLEGFTLSILMFVAIWAVQFAVYLFYKQLIRKPPEADPTPVLVENAVRCNVETQTVEICETPETVLITETSNGSQC